jgi:Tol biopolymer transport system component
MNADGSNIRRLTAFAIDATDPHWSPDGKRLLFNTYKEPARGQSANVFTMRADGTHRVELTRYAGGAVQAFADGWSPDGTQIVFRRLTYSGTHSEVGGYYIFNMHSKRIRRLTHVLIRDDALSAWGRRPV